MSIAILMLTVVTRLADIEKTYSGGIQEYSSSPYVWYDDFLVGSSFMNSLDVNEHVNHLKQYITCFEARQSSQSIAVVDQSRGILTTCDWLEFRKDVSGQAVCWLKGKMQGQVVMPKELSGFW